MRISRALYQWRRNLERFVQEHSGAVLLLAALFTIGVIFGALAVRSLPSRDRLELVAYLDGSMSGLRNPPEGAPLLLLRESLLGKAQWLAILWVLGISLVGVFGVMLLTFIRGLVTGFAVAYLAAEMGFKGVILATAGHLPQSLIEVPALILAGAASVAFSMQVIRSWKERRRVPHFYPAIASYTGTLLSMGALLVLASLVESYLSPRLVQMAVALMHLG